MWLAVLISCTSSGPAISTAEVDPFVQTLSEVADGHVGSGPGVVFGGIEDAWTWRDPRGDVVVPFSPEGRVRAAGEANGSRFVLAHAIYVLVRDDAIPAGGDALADLELIDLCGDGEQLWVHTGSGVWVWRRDLIAELTIDGTSVEGPVACGAQLFDERAAWVVQGDRVHAVAGRGNQFEVFETATFDAPVDAIAVDGDGRPWVVAEQRLYRRIEVDAWQELRLGNAVWSVLGGQASAGVWAITSSGPRWLSSALAEPVAYAMTEGPGVNTEPIGRWQTDDLGRLLVRDPSGLHRVSVDRPLWLEGLESGQVVRDLATLQLLPTPATPPPTLSVWVRGPEVSVPVDEQGRATLDVAVLGPGAVTVQALATYDDGGIAQVDYPVTLELGDGITWSEHVQPIHEGSCALCHANAAETILDGPGDWQAQIDTVLEQVRIGAMPLGDRPNLTPAQIALIEAWADGGFLP